MMEMGLVGPWCCDTCGDLIESVNDGTLQWLNEDSASPVRYAYSPQLVHRVGCLYDKTANYQRSQSTMSDLDFTFLVGPNGLMQLLGMLYEQRFKDSGELIEIIKRLFIPGYDEVRMHLQKAEDAGVYEPNTAPGFPYMYQIESIQSWLRSLNPDHSPHK